MAINKKLIHFNTKASFERELEAANILDTSICFIKDSQEIYTHGKLYSGKDEVVISETEPENADIWIDLLDEQEILPIEDAPIDGNQYVRKDGEWSQISLSGDYLTESDLDDYAKTEDLADFITDAPSDDKIYARKNGTWVEAEAAAPTTEVVTITLQSNQTASALNGLQVSWKAANSSEFSGIATWEGNPVTFNIPADIEYIIEAEVLSGYAKTENPTYTAVAGFERTFTFNYEACSLTIVREFSPNATVASSQVSIISFTEDSTTILDIENSITILIPYYSQHEVTFQDIEGWKTPSDWGPNTITTPTQTVTGTYQATDLTIIPSSNQSENLTFTATVTYGSTTQTLNFSSFSSQTIRIPRDSSYTVAFSSVTGYKKPSNISGTASGATATASGQYQSEFVTVNVSGATGFSISNTLGSAQTSASKTYKVAYGTTYTFTPGAVSGYTTPSAQSYTASQANRTITITYEALSAVDLSMKDIHGNALSSMNTANCYVVKTAGNYKFPLVYGNSIKNGQVNSQAYTEGSGSNQGSFYDGAGTVISGAAINDATTVQLSITDTNNSVTNLAIEQGTNYKYVTFSVASVPTEGANAVISVKNSSGTILWNWHIWLWPDDLTPVTITSYNSINYSILPVNLGSKWDSGKSKIKNWFYQWGRPTPMVCPTSYNSSSNHSTYGSLSYTTADCASSPSLGIANPTTFYKYNTSNYNWFSNSYKNYNYWDADCNSTGASDNVVVKTVYDPCPVGFHVPNGNIFTGFTITGSSTSSSSNFNVVGSFSNGWYFKKNSSDTTGVFFPASGCRDGSYGSLSSVGSSGYCWCSAPYNSSSAYYLYFISSGVYPQNYYSWATGFSVRPVAEL